MKLILMVLSLSTVQAHAQSSDPAPWYSIESRSCRNGEALSEGNGDTAADSLADTDTRYQISEDFTELIVESRADDVTIKRAYALTLMGKNTYLASPLSGGDESDYFFITTSDFPSRVVISELDRSGEACRGGLIVTSVSASPGKI